MLDNLPPAAVRTLCAGLSMAEERVSWFAPPLASYADDRAARSRFGGRWRTRSRSLPGICCL